MRSHQSGGEYLVADGNGVQYTLQELQFCRRSKPLTITYENVMYVGRWYKKKYGKRFKHFFRRGFNEGLHIKVISESMSPLAHYCRYGHAEGRELWLLTAVGAFDGVLDKVAFMSVRRACY